MLCNGRVASTEAYDNGYRTFNASKSLKLVLQLQRHLDESKFGLFEQLNCALVGGANLVYHPNLMKMMSDSNFLSHDGRCWGCGRRANGYARGEGTAAVVVKRLADALRDGDTIRAVIRNTASNQDERTPGITQPSQEAQTDLIERAYRQANLEMGPSRFFEAHGTGTPVGDPIEANAIGMVFKQYRSPDDPLHTGAVKANIGHLRVVVD
ncbi:hypothetical protein AAE478_002604 [Parahypoxylon ruwenzoriense]